MESIDASKLRATIEQNEIDARSLTYLYGLVEDLSSHRQHIVF